MDGVEAFGEDVQSTNVDGMVGLRQREPQMCQLFCGWKPGLENATIQLSNWWLTYDIQTSQVFNWSLVYDSTFKSVKFSIDHWVDWTVNRFVHLHNSEEQYFRMVESFPVNLQHPTTSQWVTPRETRLRGLLALSLWSAGGAAGNSEIGWLLVCQLLGFPLCNDTVLDGIEIIVTGIPSGRLWTWSNHRENMSAHMRMGQSQPTPTVGMIKKFTSWDAQRSLIYLIWMVGIESVRCHFHDHEAPPCCAINGDLASLGWFTNSRISQWFDPKNCQ